MMKQILVPLLLLVLLAGCAHHEQIQPPPAPPRATIVSPPPPKTTSGSLWNNRQGGLFYDNKARHVGDIVTVVIQETASASKSAATSTGRSSSISAGVTNLLGLERTLQRMTGSDPSSLLGASTTNDFSGSGETTRSEDLSATLSTQVVEVLPNGNLRIEGSKAVKVNNETQLVRLTGIVRSADISASNLVDSKYVLDARIDYSGKGVISDKQKPGWLVRLIDAVSPF